MFSVCMKTVNELYVLLTMLILYLIKHFCCSSLVYQNVSFKSELGHLSFPMVQQFLLCLARIRSRRFPYKRLEENCLHHLLPTHKKNLNKKKIMLTLLIHKMFIEDILSPTTWITTISL